ncbi:O-antigen ligase family protein [Arcobacter defluvii]|nr:O-antigen ligase family protein [Arcobacter defluvii]
MLFVFFLVSLTIQSFDGIYQSIIGYDLFKNNVGNLKLGLTGATFNRNIFGLIVGLGVIICILFRRVEKRINYLIVVLGVLFIFCTLFSYSRAVWFGIFLALFIYIFSDLRRIYLKDFIYLFILFLLISFSFIFIDSLHNRIELLFNGNSSNRDKIWVYTFDLIKEKPILGWGLDNWSKIGLQPYSNIHNSVLEILLYLGIIGFFCYCYFLFLVLKEVNLYKNIKAFSILIYMIVVSFFDQDIFTGKIFLSFFTILMFYIYSDRINLKESVK